MVPNIRFTELLADIEPSPTTKGEASMAHTNLRSYLRNHASFKKRWLSDFLAGSYIRDTAIRPKKTAEGAERPDVDIIVVTNFSASDDPEDVLNELCDALERDYTVERINKRSVRVVTAKAEIDVVPVTEDGDVYQLPDRDLEHWKRTNPPGHTAWSAQRNKDFDGRFKPLVKLLKSWRRENKTGKRPKGFVLEVLVSMHAPIGEAHYGEAFAKLLENLDAAYGATSELGVKPYIDDPDSRGMTSCRRYRSRIGRRSWPARMFMPATHGEPKPKRTWKKRPVCGASCSVIGSRQRRTSQRLIASRAPSGPPLLLGWVTRSRTRRRRPPISRAILPDPCGGSAISRG